MTPTVPDAVAGAATLTGAGGVLATAGINDPTTWAMVTLIGLLGVMIRQLVASSSAHITANAELRARDSIRDAALLELDRQIRPLLRREIDGRDPRGPMSRKEQDLSNAQAQIIRERAANSEGA